jgi:serine/threonine-protein kinase
VSEGLSFGAYRVVRKIGQGGMGAVYLGEHSLIGRRAAIKVLHRDRSSQREHIERFFTEARATSVVEDPGIVQIYDFGFTPQGTAYLVMEYLDGESLSARMRRLHLLQPYDALRIVRQIAGSLSAAHGLGIVHRDLKPENLFMVRDALATSGERPKILDFGIAKLGDDSSGTGPQTRTGAVMGTPAYMSPEQCNDTGKIDHRTDIYSLGCVLFHLLTGRPPFYADGVGAMIAAHLKEAPPRVSSVRPHVPVVVDGVVAKCLAKRPDERFSTMIELQQAIDAVMQQLPSELPTLPQGAPVQPMPDATTTLGTSVGESSMQLPRKRLGLWIGVSTAAVAAGIVLAIITTASSREAALETTNTVPAAPVRERPKFEPKIDEPKPEPKIEPKLEPKVEAKIEPKVEAKTEDKPIEKPVAKVPVRTPIRTPVKKPPVKKPGPYDNPE